MPQETIEENDIHKLQQQIDEVPKSKFSKVLSLWKRKSVESAALPSPETPGKSSSNQVSPLATHQQYNAMTLGRPAQLSPNSIDSPADEKKVDDKQLRSWYVKYRRDDSKTNMDTESYKQNSKDTQVPPKPIFIGNDMSKWYILQYASSETGTSVLQMEGSSPLDELPRKDSIVEKLLMKRKKQQEQAKPQVILPFEKLQLTKHEIRRQEIIYELIVTERDYASDMRVMSDLIIKKIREKKLLSNTGIKKVFSNAEEIVGVNEMLYKKLFERRAANFESAVAAFNETQGRGNNAKRAASIIQSYSIGDVLMSLTPYLRSYAQYCSNHTEASEYLQMRLANANSNRKSHAANAKSLNARAGREVVRKEEIVNNEEQKLKDNDLALFLQYCSFRPECRNLDIFSFLIKPVQRICKYPLLIKELLKFTDKTHQDYHLLSRALMLIEKVVSEVNERRRFLEGQQTRMVDLRKVLDFSNAFLIGVNSDPRKAFEPLQKTHFDILGEPSRKLVREMEENIVQIHELSKDGTHAELKDCSSRKIIIFSDVLILAKHAEKGMFFSETPKIGVKTLFKILDILKVEKGHDSNPELDKITISSKNKVGYIWHIVLDVLGKLPSDDNKRKTLKKKSCKTSEQREELIDLIKSTVETAKKDFEERRRLLSEKQSKGIDQPEDGSKEFEPAEIDLDAALAAIDKQFATQMKQDTPEEEGVSLGLAQIQLIAQSMNIKSAPSLDKVNASIKNTSIMAMDKNHAKLLALYSSSLPNSSFMKLIKKEGTGEQEVDSKITINQSVMPMSHISRSSLDLFHELDGESDEEETINEDNHAKTSDQKIVIEGKHENHQPIGAKSEFTAKKKENIKSNKDLSLDSLPNGVDTHQEKSNIDLTKTLDFNELVENSQTGHFMDTKDKDVRTTDDNGQDMFVATANFQNEVHNMKELDVTNSHNQVLAPEGLSSVENSNFVISGSLPGRNVLDEISLDSMNFKKEIGTTDHFETAAIGFPTEDVTSEISGIPKSPGDILQLEETTNESDVIVVIRDESQSKEESIIPLDNGVVLSKNEDNDVISVDALSVCTHQHDDKLSIRAQYAVSSNKFFDSEVGSIDDTEISQSKKSFKDEFSVNQVSTSSSVHEKEVEGNTQNNEIIESDSVDSLIQSIKDLETLKITRNNSCLLGEESTKDSFSIYSQASTKPMYNQSNSKLSVLTHLSKTTMEDKQSVDSVAEVSNEAIYRLNVQNSKESLEIAEISAPESPSELVTSKFTLNGSYTNSALSGPHGDNARPVSTTASDTNAYVLKSHPPDTVFEGQKSPRMNHLKKKVSMLAAKYEIMSVSDLTSNQESMDSLADPNIVSSNGNIKKLTVLVREGSVRETALMFQERVSREKSKTTKPQNLPIEFLD